MQPTRPRASSKPRRVLPAFTVAAAILVVTSGGSTARAGAVPAQAHLETSRTRTVAQRMLHRYFDAIRADDKQSACRLYRIPGCGDRTSFRLAAYDLGGLHRLQPPADGDWAGVVYLYAPRRRNGTRDVAVALAVVSCRPACRITGFYDTRS
jgi:hypothetical protein